MVDVIQAPTVEEISSAIKNEFPGKVEVTKTEIRRVYMNAPREVIFDLCTFIHDKLTFEHCSTVTGVDRETTLQAVYHLTNYYNGVMIEIVADIPTEDPHIASVTPIWEGANWHEREAYELFGIVFDGHPKLERLLTPAYYEYYPFRKSYKLRRQD
jgi:NADH-quinone oxidoreductase subunit C